MDPTKISIVLVSGSWHTEFHIQPALAPFQKAGYRVVPCPLYAAGIREPRATFADELNRISSAIATEIKAGKNVCLIAHSMAGFPSVEAMNVFLSTATDEERSKLIHLIFVSSFLDRKRQRGYSIKDGWQSVDQENGYSYPLGAERIFYNDMSVEQSRPFVEALQPMAIWYDAPDSLSSDRWKQIRRTYISCLQDNGVPIENQDTEIRENDFEVVRVDMGHCPFISQPEKFVDIVDGVLKS